MDSRTKPTTVNRELCAAIIEATRNDIRFVIKDVPTHSELGGHKTGYLATSVRGFELPEDVKVSYVHEVDRAGASYWYVVSWLPPDLRPSSEEVSSEDEARQRVFEHLYGWASPES